jgi:hypothetical protein
VERRVELGRARARHLERRFQVSPIARDLAFPHLRIVALFRDLRRHPSVVLELEIVHVPPQIADVTLAPDQQRAQMLAVAGRVLLCEKAIQTQMAVAPNHQLAHGIGAPPVVVQDLGQDAAPESALHQRDPQIPVLAAVAHRHIEAADCFERAASHERRSVHGVHVEQRRKIARRGRPVLGLIAEGAQPMGDEGERRVFVERGDRPFQQFRVRAIVGGLR